jgi:hypothetical protein
MTDHSTRAAYEADTYRLFADRAAATDFDTYELGIANVFRAMWHSSLPVDRIAQIAEGLNGYAAGSLDADKIKAALTRLTRAKVLRSSTANGNRLYEVNY